MTERSSDGIDNDGRPKMVGAVRVRSTVLPRPFIVLLMGLGMVLASGCGAIVEAAIEEVAEEATGVEIDDDDGTLRIEGDDISLVLDAEEDGSGSFSIESSEGSVRIDGDREAGTVEVTTEGFEGEEDQTLAFTAEAEVPDDFPVPFPDGATVESGGTFDNGTSRLMHVGLRYPSSSFEPLVAYYEAHFADDDGAAKHDVVAGAERTVGFVTNPDGHLTAVTVIDSADGAVVYIETTLAP